MHIYKFELIIWCIFMVVLVLGFTALSIHLNSTLPMFGVLLGFCWDFEQSENSYYEDKKRKDEKNICNLRQL